MDKIVDISLAWVSPLSIYSCVLSLVHGLVNAPTTDDDDTASEEEGGLFFFFVKIIRWLEKAIQEENNKFF